MGRTPLPHPARVRTAGGATVASSGAAVREDARGEVPTLWFPRSDVDGEALGRLDPGCWRAGAGDLADHVSFDPDALVVEVVEVVERPSGDGGPGAAVTRFPCWGDAADLVALLDVQPDGDLRFVGRARDDWRRPVVEGSQILGQTVVAAGRRSPGRRAVHASIVLTRAVDAAAPYAVVLEPVTEGRTFAAYATQAIQGSRRCAAGTVLCDVTAPAVIRHHDALPDVGSPADAVPYDMGVTGRELRIVDDAYTGDPDAPVGPPVLDAWVRFRELPDDRPLHAGLLAQFTGHLAIAAALRPHAGVGQDQAHVTLSTAVNAISLSIHADVHADGWLRYHHRSAVATDGMTHAECRVVTEDGEPVASFTVDAMVRGFAEPWRAADPRRAL